MSGDAYIVVGRHTFICRNEDMHPYECDGPGACKHCDRIRDDEHDPKTCALCGLDGWETE